VYLRWYIVHAYSNFEHKVKSSLEERIERMGLQDKFGEILVPTEEVVEMKEGQKRRSERKFFPGYVLVQMDMDDVTWHLVKEVPKVLVLSADRAIDLRRSRTRKQIRFWNASRKASTSHGRRYCSSPVKSYALLTVRSMISPESLNR
jgi:transcription antitermination factor NusG